MATSNFCVEPRLQYICTIPDGNRNKDLYAIHTELEKS